MIRILVLLSMLATPVAGDWLVMHDGTRLETEGSWEVKGRQVVFTRPGGALAALRLADVDLEASAEATMSAAAAVETPAPAPPAAPDRSPRRPSRWVLTNDDIPSREDAEAEDGDSTETEGEGDDAEGDDAEGDDAEADADGSQDGAQGASSPVAAPAAPSDPPLEVVSWREQESTAVDGLEIVGTVRNRGRDVAAAVEVQVAVSDEDGSEILNTRAFLQKPSLAPGDSSTFRALLPGIYVLLVEPVFDVSSEGFTIQGTARPAGSSDDEAPDDFDDFDDFDDDEGEPPP